MNYGTAVAHKAPSRRLTTRPAGFVVEPTDADIERGQHVHGNAIDGMVLVHWGPAMNWVTTWEYATDLKLWHGEM